MSKQVSIDVRSKSVSVSGKGLQILGKVSTTISAGSFVSIIGPSGCGKSTLLRLIMGLDVELDGSICVGDKPISGVGIDRGIVFQEARLLPWMRVRDNITFAAPRNAPELDARVDRLIALFGLSDFAQAWPNQLSGGMMQRVAIARSMVNLPEVLLMDEPFGALDAHTKTVLQEELAGIFATHKTTTIMVTHDVEEAVYLSDTILVLSGRPGRLLETFHIDIDRPRDRLDPDFAKLRFKILQSAFGTAGS